MLRIGTAFSNSSTCWKAVPGGYCWRKTTEACAAECGRERREVMMSERGLTKTGVKGLDSILLGGIPRTNVILVEGVTGSGKTLMGVEFIYRGITEYNEPGLIVVFETNPDKIIRDAAGFGWNLDELQHQKKLQIIFTSPQVFDQELRSRDSLLLEFASEIGAQRIFVDNIGLLSTDLGGSNSARGGYRELLQQLIESLNRENLTAVLSLEIGSSAGFGCDYGNDRFSRGYGDPVGQRTEWPAPTAQLGGREEPGPGL